MGSKKNRLSNYKYLVYLQIILAATFWGISYVWMKVVLEYYSPITTMFLRLSISSALIFVIFRKSRQKINRQDYPSFFILSFLSPFCYFLGESFGLLHVSATVAAVIIATIPVFTPLLGLIAFKERLSLINIVGFAVSFAGVLIMVLDADMKLTASPLGLGLLFFAVLSALVNIIFLKRLTAKYSSFTIISVQNLVGALLFMPLFFVFDFGQFLITKPSAQALGSLLALAVFASTLAFMFYTTGVRILGIARTSIFTNLIPVITAITSFIFLKEAIDQSKFLGIMMVLSGLFLTQLTRLGIKIKW